MKKASIVLLALILAAAISVGVYYAITHYGTITYQWKTNLRDYREYRLVGDSTLNGYVRADGDISVYILTKEELKKLKDGEPFNYYKAWEHVKSVELNDIKIPEGDYVLVVKNEEKGMQWISVKLVDKK
ncbi:hypothetical protein X802_04995 [Thermococcus guaymasensis DSM 11113]|uniref:Uncharacterized protein n=1 Tax=Thermococcus guaymasensis DSM 11113 TaxID=1432656 RepID=A0A0X1KK01_9EURY|nr:hypothetical protein [Thermococcus guaymasensis]AJC71601.1 hypothetical protein X802_04995 [Thermococcus guaymasensis DSM 11113]